MNDVMGVIKSFYGTKKIVNKNISAIISIYICISHIFLCSMVCKL